MASSEPRRRVVDRNQFDFRASVIHRATGKLKYPANVFRYFERQVMPRDVLDSHFHGTKVLWGWVARRYHRLPDCA
jgi:hypothetical protein